MGRFIYNPKMNTQKAHSKSEKLNQIIDKLDMLYDSDKSHIELKLEKVQDKTIPYFVCNEQGLMDYIFELLTVLLEKTEDPTHIYHQLENHRFIKNGELMPHRVEFVDGVKFVDTTDTDIKGILLGTGCFLIIGGSIISAIVGAYHIFQWILT